MASRGVLHTLHVGLLVVLTNVHALHTNGTDGEDGAAILDDDDDEAAAVDEVDATMDLAFLLITDGFVSLVTDDVAAATLLDELELLVEAGVFSSTCLTDNDVLVSPLDDDEADCHRLSPRSPLSDVSRVDTRTVHSNSTLYTKQTIFRGIEI